MRKGPVALAALALGAAVWLALQTAPTAVEVPNPRQPAPDTQSPVENAPTKLATKPAADAQDGSRGGSPGDPAPPQPAPPDKPHEPEAKLVVVDSATGKPLGGVTVAILDMGGPPRPEIDEFARSESDPVAVTFRFGRTVTSDDAGRFPIPSFRGHLHVAGRLDERRGFSCLDPAAPEDRLELHVGRPLTVVVRDADGTPRAGVGVLVIGRRAEGEWPLCEAIVTDSTGTARFADIAARAERDVKSAFATVALPFAPRPAAAVRLDEPTAGPVTLVLPATGSVRCEIVDGTGAAVADGQEVLLRNAGEGSRFFVEQGPERFDDTHAKTHGGAAVFPLTGLGMDLDAVVPSADGTFATVTRHVVGPTEPGQQVVTRIQLGSPRPVFAGRVVGVDEKPAADLEIAAQIIEPGRPGDSFGDGAEYTKTDAEGRFRFAFDRDADGIRSAKLSIGHVIHNPRSWGAHEFAQVALPSAVRAGVTDVGDVVYRFGQVLLAGRVVDEKGRPLEGVAVHAMKVDDEEEAELQRKSRGDSRPPSRSPLGDVAEVRTDETGAFLLRGDPAVARVGVGVELSGRCAAGTPVFRAGTTDARVEMILAGGFEGNVLFPDGERPEGTQFLVSGPPIDNGDGGYRFASRHFDDFSEFVKDNGRFSVTTLRPGKARVRLRLGWNDSDPTVDLGEFEIQAGVVTRDPRLTDIDLSARVQSFEVRVVDDDGNAIENAVIGYRPRGSGDWWKSAEPTGRKGSTRVLAAPGSVEMVATCPGYSAAPIPAGEGELRVVLRRSKWTEIVVRLADDVPLPAPPFSITASLVWIAPGATAVRDVHDPRDADNRSAFDETRRVAFRTSEAGEFRVTLTLHRTVANFGGTGSSLPTVPESTDVTVAGDGEPVEVVVRVDAETLRARTSRQRDE